MRRTMTESNEHSAFWQHFNMNILKDKISDHSSCHFNLVIYTLSTYIHAPMYAVMCNELDAYIL